MTSLAALPTTLTVDWQPYGCETLGDLRWETQAYRDYNNGGATRYRVVLCGTVLEGTERSYLLGHVSVRDTKGQSRVVYGVSEAEITSGHIVRVAM